MVESANLIYQQYIYARIRTVREEEIEGTMREDLASCKEDPLFREGGGKHAVTACRTVEAIT